MYLILVNTVFIKGDTSFIVLLFNSLLKYIWVSLIIYDIPAFAICVYCVCISPFLLFNKCFVFKMCCDKSDNAL